MIIASRYHDISTGHRVLGHENKCAHLHGHNYRIHFHVTCTDLDDIGRVLDFSIIKSKLCMWLEENWDHKMLIYNQDPYATDLEKFAKDDLVIVPFNPTAENMAEYLCEVIGPEKFNGTDYLLYRCIIEETRKCSVEYRIEGY
jgi:6-pyruvoyltetrahydropterin/6-carboxytetrahydropterin synthase